MELEKAEEDRLAVARRIYKAMCAHFPDQVITLVDQQGRILARSDLPEELEPGPLIN
jgi:hypothetical protein